MATNRRLVDATGSEWYPTPAWGTRALLKYVQFTGEILEPCCGTGEMAEVLKETGCPVIASDLYDRGYGRQEDFFAISRETDNIVTNPPFNIAEDILDHALTLARKQVALLLRVAFLESRRRYERFFRDRPPAQILVFSERLSMFPAGDERESGGTTSYAWFVFHRLPEGGKHIPMVKWIEPGLKPKYTRKDQMEMILI